MMCEHPSFHVFPSLGYKQCTICGKRFKAADEAKQIEHKRRSQI